MMNRREFASLSGVGLLGTLAYPTFSVGNERPTNASGVADFDVDLDEIRALADSAVGPLPVGINLVKVADSVRPANVVLKGGDAGEQITLARTVYQLGYPDGSIMLDSGMDLETHRLFNGEDRLFYSDRYGEVRRALENARLIVLSHYHGDHVGGVIRHEKFEEISRRVWASADTVELMLKSPHKETLEISRKDADRFIVSDFAKYYPIARGLVAIKAPGHTTDSKMFYIRLSGGEEFIHSIDSGWSLRNIVEGKLKNAPWVKENGDQLHAQYRWLRTILSAEPNVTILCSHDNDQFLSLRESGAVGSRFV